MTASTDLDETLANIRARAEAATEGPWHIGGDPTGHEAVRSPRRDHVADCRYAEDAEFIAHARADVELLLKIVAEQRAVITRVREVLAEAERRTAASLSCDFNGNRFQSPIAQHDLRAALDGADTTTTEPTECDHPGVEHGPFWATGTCPKCRRCKFIGHGPLCVDCLIATATDGSEA